MESENGNMSPPPSYRSLFPEQANSQVQNSSLCQNLHPKENHQEEENFRDSLRSFEFSEFQKFFVDETSRKKVISNQQKINKVKSPTRLDTIDVYPLHQVLKDKSGRKQEAEMLSHEEYGTTFVEPRVSSKSECIEYLLLPPLSHKDVFVALRNWSLENHYNEKKWNSLHIDGINTSYVWQYKLGTVTEFRNFTSEKKPSSDSQSCTSKCQNTSSAIWSVEVKRPENLQPKTFFISNETSPTKCNDCGISSEDSTSKRINRSSFECSRTEKCKPHVQVTTYWNKMFDTCFSDIIDSERSQSRKQIPDHFLRRCLGKRGYEYTSESGEVNPLTIADCLEKKMIDASQKLLKLHKVKSKNGRIVKQKHKIISIPVYEVLCRQGGSRFCLCVVGTNHQVYLPRL